MPRCICHKVSSRHLDLPPSEGSSLPPATAHRSRPRSSDHLSVPPLRNYQTHRRSGSGAAEFAFPSAYDARLCSHGSTIRSFLLWVQSSWEMVSVSPVEREGPCGLQVVQCTPSTRAVGLAQHLVSSAWAPPVGWLRTASDSFAQIPQLALGHLIPYVLEGFGVQGSSSRFLVDCDAGKPTVGAPHCLERDLVRAAIGREFDLESYSE